MSPRNRTRLPRQRSIREVIGSIFLGFELFVVFLGTLLIFGMRVLDPVPAFVLGAAFGALILVTIRFLRHEWGIWLGWAVQVLLVAAGFLHPGMFVVGALFPEQGAGGATAAPAVHDVLLAALRAKL